MAQFDLYRLDAGALVVDCQNNALKDIGTRFVIPLCLSVDAPKSLGRTNPAFDIDGEAWVLLTQLAAAIPSGTLRVPVGSLDHEHFRIVDAIDALIGTG